MMMPAIDQYSKTRFRPPSQRFSPSDYDQGDTGIGSERIPVLARILIAAALALLFTRGPWFASPGLDPSWGMASDYAFHRGLKFGTDFIFTAGPYSFLHTYFFSPDTYAYVVASDVFQAALYLAPLILWGTRWSVLAFVPACLGVHLAMPTADTLFAAAALSLFAICLSRRRIETALLVALCAPILLAKYSFPVLLLPLLAIADIWHVVASRRRPIFVPTAMVALIAGWLLAGQDLTSVPSALVNTLDVTNYYGGAMQRLGKQRDLVLLFIAVTIVYGFIAVRLISLFRRGSRNFALQCLCFAIGL